jgi:hypothetical protein
MLHGWAVVITRGLDSPDGVGDHAGMAAARSSRRAVTVTAVAAAVGALLLAAPAVAHVRLRSFTITPSCTSPGSTIEHRVTVTQRHLFHIHVLWARVTVRYVPGGLVLEQRDQRTAHVPFGTYTSRGRSRIPSTAPLGNYRVTLRLGSRRGAADYGTAARSLRVRALGLCGL